MKRTLIILFTMLYGSLSTGLAFNVHYCQGEIEDIFFASQEEESSCCETACCEAPKETKPSCCEDEVVLIQFNGEQVVPQKGLDSEKEITGLTPTIINFEVDSNGQEGNIVIANFQASDSSLPLWLLHCNFTFYG